MRSVVPLVVLAACGSPSATPDAAGGDAAIDANAADAPGLRWESVVEVSNDGQVITEDVTYRSEGLLIRGRICRPADGARHKVAMYNHGGFNGLAIDLLSATCADAAKFGYVWIASSYRGEEGSEGSIEVCLGEVTDVLAMLEIALAQPYADPTRVVMYGGSHGGCITLRAIERGAPVHAAVAIYPPSDLARMHADWTARIAANDPQKATLQQLRTIVETATGGTPATVPAAYSARSPEAFVADVPAGVPLLVTHGVADSIVGVSESCSFVAALSPLPNANVHVDPANAPVAGAPAACSTSGLTWTTVHPRPGWSSTRYLIVYDGLDHTETGTQFQNLQVDVASFLMAKVP